MSCPVLLRISLIPIKFDRFRKIPFCEYFLHISNILLRYTSVNSMNVSQPSGKCEGNYLLVLPRIAYLFDDDSSGRQVPLMTGFPNITLARLSIPFRSCSSFTWNLPCEKEEFLHGQVPISPGSAGFRDRITGGSGRRARPAGSPIPDTR